MMLDINWQELWFFMKDMEIILPLLLLGLVALIFAVWFVFIKIGDLFSNIKNKARKRNER